MGIHSVTLEGYGGWAIPLWIMGTVFVVWLAWFILMGRLVPTSRWSGDQYGNGDWRWFARWYSILAIMVVLFVGAISTSAASRAWDDEQRLDALSAVDVENIDWDVKNYNRFVGTIGSDVVFGYFQHIEGEQWNLIVGDSK